MAVRGMMIMATSTREKIFKRSLIWEDRLVVAGGFAPVSASASVFAPVFAFVFVFATAEVHEVVSTFSINDCAGPANVIGTTMETDGGGDEEVSSIG